MSANTFTNIVDRVMAGGLMTMRENAVTSRFVLNDFSGIAQEKGSTVDLTLPTSITAAAVSAGSTPFNATGLTPSVRTITLDQWYEASFAMTDKEMNEVATRANYIPVQAEEAVKALINKIDSTLLAKYVDFYEFSGAAGTTPFASDSSLVNEAKRKLATNLAPVDNRAFLIDEFAQENIEKLSNFADISKSADPNILRTGEMGFKYNFRWAMNQNMPTHTKGTLSGTTGAGKALINDASVDIGQTTIALDDTSLTGTMVAGDVFTVAGDTQTYTVVTGGTASGNALSITFYPGAKVAWADDAVLTMKASHVNNLAFHRNALALVMRPLANPPVTSGNIIRTAVDPISGIPLRLEISRQNKQTLWQFDALWGVQSIDRSMAVRVAG